MNGFAPINQTQFVLTYANRLEWKDATGNLTTTFQTGEAPISVKVINEKVYYSTTAGTYILTVSALNSIQDLSANLNLKGYPNPAKDNWTLQTSTLPQDSYTLNLVNLNGTIVYTRTEETGQNIEIQPNFPAGLYFYTLVSPSGLIAKGKVFFESATE